MCDWTIVQLHFSHYFLALKEAERVTFVIQEEAIPEGVNDEEDLEEIIARLAKVRS